MIDANILKRQVLEKALEENKVERKHEMTVMKIRREFKKSTVNLKE